MSSFNESFNNHRIFVLRSSNSLKTAPYTPAAAR